MKSANQKNRKSQSNEVSKVKGKEELLKRTIERKQGIKGTLGTLGRAQLLLLVPLLSMLFTVNCKSVYTELQINASPEEVWAVLIDNGKYGEWNPYHRRVEGELKPGEQIVVEIHKPNGNQITLEPKVLRMIENRELTWGGGIPGLFTGEHVIEIRPSGTGILLVHREQFNGIFVLFAELDTIEEGYQLMNQALKDRVEASSPGL
ncbi:MAG: hypothetical protein CMF59_09120 [Leptospiraceae bacterium]|nr:hypothetical protein [Leptospiraceae bacterium]